MRRIAECGTLRPARLTGPAVDIGVGALHAIFSDDSTPQAPDGTPPPPALSDALVRPILSNLQKTDDDFKKIFSGLDAVERNLSGRIEAATLRISGELKALGDSITIVNSGVVRLQQGVDKLLLYQKMSIYNEFLEKVKLVM